ncbi:MAG: tripartite tricarboxylate transporter permease [Chloroflexi bacterium]|nr:tripartite tricarboxylate transporter permease [Chloroflexota bacterium]
MFEAMVQALGNIASPTIWVWVSVGLIAGLLLGILPGISSLTGLTLFLPFVFRLEPMQALPLMVSMASVGYTAGSITAVLLGIPGEPANAATILDGFPMTQKGEGSRALGAAITASLMGGAVPVFLALAMVWAVMPIIMAVTSMDMVVVIAAGLVVIGVVAKGAMLKGVISGGIGLLISSIGLAPMTGVPRFTFDMPYLYDGLHLSPVAMGLFAVPPMIELALEGGESTLARSGAAAVKGMAGAWEGARDVFRHWWLWARSSFIGYLFGLMPGVGANSAVWVTYGIAKQSSKHPETFGTGNVEGVIAPESANNAKESGALLTTLALGIPGSAGGAIFLAAFIMLGFRPGPSMLTEQLDLSLTILILVALANIIAGAICFPVAPYLASIARVPGRILVPVVFVLIFVAAYASSGQMADIVVLLIFSAVGVAAKRHGYNIPALFLGYILGELFEQYLFLGLQLGGPLFFIRPIPLVIIFLVALFFAYRPLKGAIGSRFGRARTA